MRNSKDHKPYAEKRCSRLADIDEIWAWNILPSPVQQQQRSQQLWNLNMEGDVLSEHASAKDLNQTARNLQQYLLITELTGQYCNLSCWR